MVEGWLHCFPAADAEAGVWSALMRQREDTLDIVQEKLLSPSTRLPALNTTSADAHGRDLVDASGLRDRVESLRGWMLLRAAEAAMARGVLPVAKRCLSRFQKTVLSRLGWHGIATMRIGDRATIGHGGGDGGGDGNALAGGASVSAAVDFVRLRCELMIRNSTGSCSGADANADGGAYDANISSLLTVLPKVVNLSINDKKLKAAVDGEGGAGGTGGAFSAIDCARMQLLDAHYRSKWGEVLQRDADAGTGAGGTVLREQATQYAAAYGSYRQGIGSYRQIWHKRSCAAAAADVVGAAATAVVEQACAHTQFALFCDALLRRSLKAGSDSLTQQAAVHLPSDDVSRSVSAVEAEAATAIASTGTLAESVVSNLFEGMLMGDSSARDRFPRVLELLGAVTGTLQRTSQGAEFLAAQSQPGNGDEDDGAGAEGSGRQTQKKQKRSGPADAARDASGAGTAAEAVVRAFVAKASLMRRRGQEWLLLRWVSQLLGLLESPTGTVQYILYTMLPQVQCSIHYMRYSHRYSAVYTTHCTHIYHPHSIHYTLYSYIPSPQYTLHTVLIYHPHRRRSSHLLPAVRAVSPSLPKGARISV
jgi:hypothetical protein